MSKSIEELQKLLDEARAKRARLTSEKLVCVERLNQLSAQVKGKRVPSWQYAEVCASQAAVRSEMAKIESGIIHCKTDIQTLSDALHAANQKEKADIPSIVLSLDLLAKKYQDFAADTSRIASMRSMAAKFAEEIRTLVRAGK